MKRGGHWVLASVLAVLPALAQADQIEVPPYAAVPPCIDLSDAPIVGSVVALTGPVAIESPSCAPAAAECGMAVHAGQTLTSGPGAQVALLAGGRYVQIGAGSRVAATAAEGTTRIAVERGAVRVIDFGSAPGPAVAVATPALETRDPGADVVASVSPNGSSSICSYADPIEVVEGERSTQVSPGSCAGAARAAATPEVVVLEGKPAVALPLSIAEVARCDVAAGGPTPTDVASGPPGSSLPPTPPPLPPPTYCQGGSCLPTPPPPPPAVCCAGGIVEQPVIFEPPPD